MKNRHNIFRINLLMILIAGMVSCTSENGDTETAALKEEPHTDIITITPSQFKSASMKLGKVTKKIFYNVVQANGIFDVPPENKAAVSAYYGGYVKEIKLLPGQKISKGQTLFTLENPEYVEMQQNFLEAKGQLVYLKSDYERQKELVADHVTSQKNYLKAEADYKVTLAKYESLKKKLWLININPNKVSAGNIRSIIAVTAPLSGFITDVHAIKGMFLNPSDIAVNITNTDHMHLELSIFERDLLVVKEEQPIKFKLQSDVNKEFEATVYLVSKSLDPQKRTADVHGHITNEADEKLFSPGMYVEAEILTSSDTLFALPQEAVINIEDRYFVLVKKSNKAGASTFERKEVVVGKSGNGFYEILNYEALQHADVLLKGAFNLIQGEGGGHQH